MELREVPIDETLEALSDSTRRTLVRRLRETGELSVDRAVGLLDEADGQEGNEREMDGPNHVRLQLHHVHVPKLADAGVIDYDRETESIEPGENADAAYEIVDAVSRVGD